MVSITKNSSLSGGLFFLSTGPCKELSPLCRARAARRGGSAEREATPILMQLVVSRNVAYRFIGDSIVEYILNIFFWNRRIKPIDMIGIKPYNTYHVSKWKA